MLDVKEDNVPQDREATFKPERTLRDVGRYLDKKLRRERLESCGLNVILYSAAPYDTTAIKLMQRDYGFTGTDRWLDVRMRFRHVACYAVTGTNEGHYIHCDLVCETVDSTGRRLPRLDQKPYKAVTVFTAKTFNGMDAAYRTARRIATLLGA
jgi:hypothetical protein